LRVLPLNEQKLRFDGSREEKEEEPIAVAQKASSVCEGKKVKMQQHWLEALRMESEGHF
jgi:hypothetical protein